MPSGSKNAVFLSYAREDTEAARRIADALRAFGMEVWFDQSELRGGEAWDQSIRRQIKECALFMPIISARTQNRTEGYFRREWKLAVDRTSDMAAGVAFIVPVVVDDTRESVALVPDEFMKVQWTRLPGALATPEFVAQIQRLLDLSGRKAVSAPHDSAPTRPAASPSKTNARRWSAVLVGAIVLGGIGYVWVRPASKSRATSPIEPKSIAVLPFVNLSADKSDEYLSDGMTEELLNVLAKVKGLRVPGRSSCFAFKGRNEQDIFRRVGEQLRVTTVLEGSVRRSGDTLRITAQLINAADGYHLWSETYDKKITDILAVQSEVAQRVVQALQVQLGVEETRALTAKPTTNVAAHELYLKGRFLHFQYTGDSSRKAIECFDQAIALDPNYARPHAGLAALYAWMSSVLLPPKEAMPIAKRNVIRALELDESLAEAHHSFATIKWWGDWDFAGAEREFKRAFELNPHDAKAYDDYAACLMQQGRFDEALAAGNKAAALDPQWSDMKAAVYYRMRRYDDAYALAHSSLQRSARPWVHIFLARICVQLGKFDEAATEARSMLNASGDVHWVPYVAAILARCGKVEEARACFAQIQSITDRHYISPVHIAMFHEAVGDRDGAFKWLEIAYQDRSDHLLDLKVDPSWDTVRDDPRFMALLRKIGIPNLSG